MFQVCVNMPQLRVMIFDGVGAVIKSSFVVALSRGSSIAPVRHIEIFFPALPVVVKPSRPCLSYHISPPLPPPLKVHVTPEVGSSRNICFFSEGGETNRPIVTPVSVLISSPLAFRTGWNYRGRVKGK